MSKQAITTFKPPPNPTKTAFVTVLYHDVEGNWRYIARNAPFSGSQSVIVTATGGIVDAKDRRTPWTDRNGKDHQQEPCAVCSGISAVCSFCTAESRLDEMKNSIGIVQNCRLANHLAQTIEKVKQSKVSEKQQEAREMINEIEKMAKMYWNLEARTKRAVGNVKVYGVTLIEAAEDYLSDGILNDFWKELTNMEEAKNNLTSANEKHEEIKSKASVLQKRAEMKAKTFRDKASKSEKSRKEDTAMSVFSIPVVGQLLSGVGGAIAGGDLALDWCKKSSVTDNIPVKVVVGAAGAAATGAGGLVVSVITMPFAPYFWYRSISNGIDAKNYGILKREFGSIAIQMGLVEEHLGKITTSLHEIEQNLEYSQRAERKVIESLDENKRQKMAHRVIQKANDLVQATNFYFNIVNNKNMDNSIGRLDRF